MKKIFLDVAAGVRANPASLHAAGVKAGRELEAARQLVAETLGAHPDEIIFTSGGTESNNLAILGLPEGEVIVSSIEHASVLAPAAARGRGVIILPVDSAGKVKIEKLAELITPQTVLVSIILANNEIGTIQSMAEIAKVVRQARRRLGTVTPYLHTDACQAARFIPLDVNKLGVDLLTLNGSKLIGPGTGVLYRRRGIPLKPLLYGGGQEGSLRPGTENVAGISAFARALAQAQKSCLKESKRLIKLRDYFIKAVKKNIPEAELNGHLSERLPNNINFSFPGVLGEQVVLELDAKGIAVSTGSACAIPKHDDSYVIMALGKDKNHAISALRFTLSQNTTAADLNYVLKILISIITKLKKTNHDYSSQFTLWI